MADVVPPHVRSRMMAGIRGTDTRPELALRRGLHRLGFRFRLHDRKLPGKPDLVFPRYRAVLFAHGCYWHGHDCHLFRWPQTRQDFWRQKIERNREVDTRTERELTATGWRIGIVWECALKGRHRLPFDEVLNQCAAWLCSERSRMEIRGGAA
ncbi:very short patch repair endonuclease [Pelagibacterium sp.]|uniref:very short patch repair endonuclease n=1 Tax=Pelagibacterium sp. TaxID=1967288 RepID=UPI003BA9BEB7